MYVGKLTSNSHGFLRKLVLYSMNYTGIEIGR